VVKGVGGWLCVVVLLLGGRIAGAHEVNVHEAITLRALDLLVSQEPQLASCNAPDVREALRKGVRDEDDDLIHIPILSAFGVSTGIGRYYFHFSDLQSKPLDDDVLDVLHPVATCDAFAWGGGLGDSPENSGLCTLTLISLIKDLPNSLHVPPPLVEANAYTLTSVVEKLGSNDDDRHHDGLIGLGHFVHLLQDMTSPAHVHNDGHPHFPWGGGDPSIFEVSNSLRLKAMTLIDGEPLPLPFDLPDIADERDAFQQLKTFTAPFLSEKTAQNLTPADVLLQGHLKPDPLDHYVYSDKGYRIAKLELAKGRVFLDERVAQDQFDMLVPEAIRYTAAVIKYVHNNRAPVCRDAMTVTRQGSGRVTSSLPGIDCGAACNHSFRSGDTVRLTAVADPGASFVEWSGACTNSSGDCVVTMDQARNVTAKFTERTVRYTFSGTCTNACSKDQRAGSPDTIGTVGAVTGELVLNVGFGEEWTVANIVRLQFTFGDLSVTYPDPEHHELQPSVNPGGPFGFANQTACELPFLDPTNGHSLMTILSLPIGNGYSGVGYLSPNNFRVHPFGAADDPAGPAGWTLASDPVLPLPASCTATP